MLGVMLGVLLAALDSSVVGTAMPNIISDLHGIDLYTWPFTAYMLCSTIIIPVSGKMADMYGRKLIYLSGIVIFLAASALCGISWNMMALIVFRGAQGMGAGIILSSAFAVVGELFSPRERGKYMGFVASMFGLSSLLGPALGGFITQTSWLGWRWIFYINIPLGIIAFLTVLFALPSAGEDLEKKKIDFLGLGAFIVAIVPFLLGFTWAGKNYAWLSPEILGMFAFSIVFFIIFYFIEKKAESPIIPLQLFRKNIFNISIGAMFMSSVAMFGIVIFLPLFLQAVLGKDPGTSGAIITPMMLSFVFASIVSGRIISATGKYKILSIVGFGFALFGTILFYFMDENVTDFQLYRNMIVLGIGLGGTMPAFNIAVQNAFPQQMTGVVTSGVQFFRNMGSTIGAAIMGSVMISRMKIHFGDIQGKMGLPAGSGSKLGALADPMAIKDPATMAKLKSTMPPDMLHKLMGLVKQGLTASLHDVFFISIVAAGIGVGFTFLLKEIPLREDRQKEIGVID